MAIYRNLTLCNEYGNTGDNAWHCNPPNNTAFMISGWDLAAAAAAGLNYCGQCLTEDACISAFAVIYDGFVHRSLDLCSLHMLT